MFWQKRHWFLILGVVALIGAGCLGPAEDIVGDPDPDPTEDDTAITGTVYTSSSTVDAEGSALGTGAQQTPGDIDDLAPLADAQVDLYRVDPDGSRTNVTEDVVITADEEGQFSITEIPGDTWANGGDSRFLLRAHYTFEDGEELTHEVFLTDLEQGEVNERDVDPVQSFARELTDDLVQSMRDLWFNLDEASLAELGDTLETGLVGWINDEQDGTLPNFRDQQETQSFYEELTQWLNTAEEVLEAFAGVMVASTDTVSIPGGMWTTVVTDEPGFPDEMLEFEDEMGLPPNWEDYDLAAIETRVDEEHVSFRFEFHNPVELDDMPEWDNGGEHGGMHAQYITPQEEMPNLLIAQLFPGEEGLEAFYQLAPADDNGEGSGWVDEAVIINLFGDQASVSIHLPGDPLATEEPLPEEPEAPSFTEVDVTPADGGQAYEIQIPVEFFDAHVDLFDVNYSIAAYIGMDFTRDTFMDFFPGDMWDPEDG